MIFASMLFIWIFLPVTLVLYYLLQFYFLNSIHVVMLVLLILPLLFFFLFLLID